ncbi:MAG: transglycosylase SLT domain-containing protein [Chitinispirillales bacterium]|jgi:hypothetical protein|nr:transglycosylase SLT domain-containing protein [Chitinispirillales bacterium]
MEFYFERLDIQNGGRFRLPEGTVSIGRSPKNTIALPADDRCVSAIHAVVYADPRRLLLQDMQSTNGTFVNGRQVNECVLEEGDEVRFGRSGPRFRVSGGGASEGAGFDIDTDDCQEDSELDDLDVMPFQAEENPVYENRPPSNQKSPRNRAFVVVAIIAALLALGLLTPLALRGRGESTPQSASADKQKSSPGKQKTPSGKQDFFMLRDDGSPPLTPAGADTGTGVNPATTVSPRGEAPNSKKTSDRIHAVLARFGETGDYRLPPEMVERVDHYLGLYMGGRRRTIASYLRRGEEYFPMIRRVLAENNLPPELAYISMLESGFDPRAVSHAGAVGLWQFMPHTARRYGLEVTAHVDERTDPVKSTRAAAAYFKHLIAIFGPKSSVMLCMAAYNAGEQRIINALKRIDDPMRNRDFWYIYRNGWLAEETNEYIPQVIAMIIVSENREEYGF